MQGVPRSVAGDLVEHATLDHASGCWEWDQRDADGYGAVPLNHTVLKAHRYIYEAIVGPIPEGLQLDHLCRNRACVNPRHLEPVTCRENLLRGETIAARNAAKTHCPRGHAFTPENTKIDRRGWRRCWTCLRARYRVRKALDAQKARAA